MKLILNDGAGAKSKYEKKERKKKKESIISAQ